MNDLKFIKKQIFSACSWVKNTVTYPKVQGIANYIQNLLKIINLVLNTNGNAVCTLQTIQFIYFFPFHFIDIIPLSLVSFLFPLFSTGSLFLSFYFLFLCLAKSQPSGIFFLPFLLPSSLHFVNGNPMVVGQQFSMG